MKKLLLATAIVGFAFAQAKAQNPASVSTEKTPANADPATGAVSPAAIPPAPAAVEPATKPTPRVAPATVRNGKPIRIKEGTHGKNTVQPVKDNSAPVKPLAPAVEDKK